MPIDDKTRRAMEENRAWWDAATPVHVRSKMYDVPSFVRGRNGLDGFILDEVGSVQGKRLLHLQCHFGQDTINWARLGAEVTGVDYSPEAIRTARSLAAEVGARAEFVESNLFDLDDRFKAEFDIVFTSWGVLCWLPDLEPWGRLIGDALKPGGFFYIAESHPLIAMFEYDQEVASSSDLDVTYPYFREGGVVRFEPSGDGDPDYADPDHRNTLPTNEWPHPLSETIGVLLQAGLEIEMFRERPALAWRMFKGMVQGSDGLWRMPDGVIQIPMSFSLKARKPG